jgi:hypothetical protein
MDDALLRRDRHERSGCRETFWQQFAGASEVVYVNFRWATAAQGPEGRTGLGASVQASAALVTYNFRDFHRQLTFQVARHIAQGAAKRGEYGIWKGTAIQAILSKNGVLPRDLARTGGRAVARCGTR